MYFMISLSIEASVNSAPFVTEDVVTIHNVAGCKLIVAVQTEQARQVIVT